MKVVIQEKNRILALTALKGEPYNYHNCALRLTVQLPLLCFKVNRIIALTVL